MSALAAFLKAAERVREIAAPNGPIAAAKALPAEAERRLTRFRPQADAYSSPLTGPEIKTFERVRAEMTDRERETAEILRDRKLRQIANELESLRAALPALAAAAAVEMGVFARQVRPTERTKP